MMGELPPDQNALFYELTWKIMFLRITCFERSTFCSI
jgi:hypothetical protein